MIDCSLLDFFFVYYPVRILPRDRYTSTLNGTAIFMCLPFPMGDPITNVQWLVNGTELEQLDLPNIVPEFDNAGRGFGTLTISTIPEFYNRTQFQCKTTTTSDVHISSDTILLLIQGNYNYVITWVGVQFGGKLHCNRPNNC